MAGAVVSKPLAVALLDRAESVQRLKRLPVPGPVAGRRAGTGPAAARGSGGCRGTDGGDHRRGGGCRHRVPAYADPESAARALGHAASYQAWRGRQRGQVPGR